MSEQGFFVNGEFWTADEWATATANADWTRRKDRVERGDTLAKRQVWQEEFDMARVQRTLQLKQAAREAEVTDEQTLAVSRWLEARIVPLVELRRLERLILEAA
jgi:hypothetical protein